MLLTAAIPPLELTDILLRLLCALGIGLVIGLEREFNNRPAGMRTHILVALGACTVMITGQMIFQNYNSQFGATPDPSRLAAQVITGVGFLGAGTIMREGASVKGLTTAASLWVVACLGIAAGGGYYTVALGGTLFVMLTLTIIETLQRRLIGTHCVALRYRLSTPAIDSGLSKLNALGKKHQAEIQDLSITSEETGFRIGFTAEFSGLRGRRRQQKFLQALSQAEEFSALQAGQEAMPSL